MHEVVRLFADEPEGLPRNSAVALDRLRGHLQTGGHIPGARLAPERQLCVALGIGRGALRRALEVLEAEGAVTRIQGSGTFFGRPSRMGSILDHIAAVTNPAEVIEARLEIEPALARLAAQRAGAAEITAIRQMSARLAAATDSDSQELWDGALHRSIAEAAGNKLMLALFEAIDRVRQNEDWRALRRRARSGSSIQDDAIGHARIVAAITERDGAASEAAMRAHLDAVARRLHLALTGEERGSDRRPDAARG